MLCCAWDRQRQKIADSDPLNNRKKSIYFVRAFTIKTNFLKLVTSLTISKFISYARVTNPLTLSSRYNIDHAHTIKIPYINTNHILRITVLNLQNNKTIIKFIIILYILQHQTKSLKSINKGYMVIKKFYSRWKS